MILSMTALLALSRVIEPVYGSREYLKFLAIVNAAAVRLAACSLQPALVHHVRRRICMRCLHCHHAQGVGAFFTVYVVYALHPTEEGNLLCVLFPPATLLPDTTGHCCWGATSSHGIHCI